MALKTMVDRMTKAREDFEKTQKEISSKAKNEIAETFGGLLPKGFRITWTQYTPYFNDGEPCVFGVRTASILTVSADNDDDDDNREDALELYFKPNKKDLPAGLELDVAIAIYDAWKLLEKSKDLLLGTFGNHTRVTIRHGGKIKTAEYDHD
jgi:hypothetical protein